jgi:hypothetical protein
MTVEERLARLERMFLELFDSQKAFQEDLLRKVQRASTPQSFQVHTAPIRGEAGQIKLKRTRHLP